MLIPQFLEIVFILLTFFGGSGILIYIVLWIIMPSKLNSHKITEHSIKDNLAEIKLKAGNLSLSENSRFYWALLIIFFGFLLLSNNLGLFNVFELDKFWPLILIVLGLFLLFKH